MTPASVSGVLAVCRVGFANLTQAEAPESVAFAGSVSGVSGSCGRACVYVRVDCHGLMPGFSFFHA